MKNLIKLKKWLTIDDAAKYLSTQFSEPVEPKDILQLALENDLKLSINFTKIIDVMEVAISPFSETTSEPSLDNFGHVNFEDKSYHVSTSPQLIKIEGAWDLKLFGGGEEYIKARLLNFLEENFQVQHTISDIYIERDKKTYCLYEKHKHYDEKNSLLILDSFLENIIKIDNTGLDDGYYKPMSTIPSHALLVVSLNSLKDFERQIELDNMQVSTNQKSIVSESIHPKERNTFLIIIAALADKAGINIDNDISSIETAKKINRLIDGIGFSLKLDTVKSKLDEIPDALERNRKDAQGRQLK
ncbi:MAG TPA: hypothetical protein VES38_02255 [Methylotenera sp.]|nr:hypothetical protein [Methylotenera sp.]